MKIANADKLKQHFENVVDVKLFTVPEICTIINTFSTEVPDNTIGVNMQLPENCLDCPFCQGEYGPGNEKSYCAIKSGGDKLKYKGKRPSDCPICLIGGTRP